MGRIAVFLRKPLGPCHFSRASEALLWHDVKAWEAIRELSEKSFAEPSISQVQQSRMARTTQDAQAGFSSVPPYQARWGGLKHVTRGL